MNNRLWNINNPHQGKYPRVLCVCSAGLLRSPTVALVLAVEYGYNTRAVGTEDYALIRMDDVHIAWADIIVFVNKETEKRAKQMFSRELNECRIVTLDLPDIYGYRDPKMESLILEQALIHFDNEGNNDI